MSTFSVIDCVELASTRKEGYDFEGGPSASVTLKVDWANRWDLIADIVGGNKEYPDFSGTVKPRAVSASCSPLSGSAYTGSGQSLNHAFAIVEITYSTKIMDLIAESIEPTLEMQTLDYKRFRWGSATGDPLVSEEAPSRQLRGMNYVRQYFQVSSVPASFFTETGKVNQNAFTSPAWGITFAAETLLFLPGSVQNTIKSDGNRAMNVTTKFNYKPEGWNKVYRAKTGTYERIYYVTGGIHYNYPLSTFSGLL